MICWFACNVRAHVIHTTIRILEIASCFLIPIFGARKQKHRESKRIFATTQEFMARNFCVQLLSVFFLVSLLFLIRFICMLLCQIFAILLEN